MASEDCVFCKISDGSIPTSFLYEDDEVIAFDDINPAAPVHFLVAPRRHVPSLDSLEEGDSALVGKLVLVAVRLAREKGVADPGYRLVANCNRDGGQVVFHLHLHVLGGRLLGTMG